MMTARRIPALDGLRTVAVSMVVVDHWGLPGLGGLGVSIFFVLSGFLITTLLLTEWDHTGDISLKAFYARRSLRIFPAYYVFLAFSWWIDSHHGDTRIQPVIIPAALYYLDYFHAIHGHSSTSIAHAWSLAIEEQFYLLWPCAFLLISRWRPERLAAILVTVIGVVMIWRTIAFTALDLGQKWAYDAFDSRCDALATGCLLAVLLAREPVANRLRALSRHGWIAVAAALPILFVELVDNGRFRYTAGFTINAILIAFVMSQLVLNPNTLAGRLLESRVMRYLGGISYGMYLYHVWGLTVGRHLASGVPGLVIGYAATVGFAMVSWYLVERGFLRLKKRFEPGVEPKSLVPVARV